MGRLHRLYKKTFFFKNIHLGLRLLDTAQYTSPEFHSKRFNRPWGNLSKFIRMQVLDKRVPLSQGPRRLALYGAPFSILFGTYSNSTLEGLSGATYDSNVLADLLQLDESIHEQRKNQSKRWGTAIGIRYVPSKLHYDIMPLPLLNFFRNLQFAYVEGEPYPFAETANYDQTLGMLSASLYEEALADCRLLRSQMLRATVGADSLQELTSQADNMRKHHHYPNRWSVELSGRGPVTSVLQREVYGEQYSIDGLRQLVRGAIGVYFQSARSTTRWKHWSSLFELRNTKDYSYLFNFGFFRFFVAVLLEVYYFLQRKG